jgi:hypothetical protein
VLRAPGYWSSSWQCERHGAVLPFHLAPHLSVAAVELLLHQAKVPVWSPHPPPMGWIISGVGWVGDDRSGAVASLIALSGPAPKGGVADLMLVAEEPGIGLGARFAGLAGPDPGAPPAGPPDVRLDAAGHDTPLWRTAPAEDRCTFAGEAMGYWLWAIAWPENAQSIMAKLELRDLREQKYPEVELVFGAPTPRLRTLPNNLPPETLVESQS